MDLNDFEDKSSDDNMIGRGMKTVGKGIENAATGITDAVGGGIADITSTFANKGIVAVGGLADMAMTVMDGALPPLVSKSLKTKGDSKGSSWLTGL